IISSLITGAQKRSEGFNSEIRKNVLKYDDVLRLQREIIYGERRAVLTETSVEDKVRNFINDTIDNELYPFIHEVKRGQYDIDDEQIITHFENLMFPKGTLSLEKLQDLDE